MNQPISFLNRIAREPNTIDSFNSIFDNAQRGLLQSVRLASTSANQLNNDLFNNRREENQERQREFTRSFTREKEERRIFEDGRDFGQGVKEFNRTAKRADDSLDLRRQEFERGIFEDNRDFKQGKSEFNKGFRLRKNADGRSQALFNEGREDRKGLFEAGLDPVSKELKDLERKARSQTGTSLVEELNNLAPPDENTALQGLLEERKKVEDRILKARERINILEKSQDSGATLSPSKEFELEEARATLGVLSSTLTDIRSREVEAERSQSSGILPPLSGGDPTIGEGQIQPEESSSASLGARPTSSEHFAVSAEGIDPNFKPPSGDANQGQSELAGFNKRDHPTQYNKIKSALERGGEAEASRVAAELIDERGKSLNKGASGSAAQVVSGVAHHRGSTGAKEVLQNIGVKDTNQLIAEAKRDPSKFKSRWVAARQLQEEKHVKRLHKQGKFNGKSLSEVQRERARKFSNGLRARWEREADAITGGSSESGPNDVQSFIDQAKGGN